MAGGARSGGYSGSSDDEGVTEIPVDRRRGRREVDFEDEGETELPGRGREDFTEIEDAVTPVLGLLWVKEGRRRGKYYPIKHSTVIGREVDGLIKKDGLVLDDPKVSSMHAKFTLEGDDFVLWDLGSSNGTFLNGKKIREATFLEENDLVKIGDTVFVLKLLESKPRRKSARAEKSGRKSAGRKSRAV